MINVKALRVTIKGLEFQKDYYALKVMVSQLQSKGKCTLKLNSKYLERRLRKRLPKHTVRSKMPVGHGNYRVVTLKL